MTTSNPSAPAISTSTPTRRPRSRIACLPHATREFINNALREGMPYYAIAHLACTMVQYPQGTISCDMLSRWYRSGYRDWLREQTQLETTIAQSNASLTHLAELQSKSGASLADLTDALLVSMLTDLQRNFDPASLRALLAEKPAEFFRLITCLNSHIAARARDKSAEVARANCQVALAVKSQISRVAPEPARHLVERQIVKDTYGGPLARFLRQVQPSSGDAKSQTSNTPASPQPAHGPRQSAETPRETPPNPHPDAAKPREI